MKTKVLDIVDLIKKNNDILITMHETPDGDAIGSTLGLYLFLKNINKNVTIFSLDPVPERLSFLKGALDVKTNFKDIENKNFDLFFVLDSADLGRLSWDIKNFKNYKKIINIDHHVSNKDFGDLNYVVSNASCTGELIYQVITNFNEKAIDKDIANCLLTAIYDDTGGLRYPSTSAVTLSIASNLVTLGASPAYISENLYFKKSLSKVNLMKKVLLSLDVKMDGRVSYLLMKKDDLESVGAKYEDSEGLIDYPRSIEGVEVSFFLKEMKKEEYRISFRSRGKVDVNVFCSRFNGGGHKNAAACTISGKLDEVLKTIFTELKKVL
jgi:bifunctional oligoribonuclease and PAP phosphatase NrnA